GRELAMISDFLDRFVRELAQKLIARLGQPLQQHVLPGRVKQVPRDGLSEVAVGLLDQQAVAEIEYVAVEREPVAVAGLIEQQSRLADLVEREVGKTDVDLEHRPMPAPFAEPLAEDERIVTQAQQVLGARVDGDGGHQMCFTSSGMS